MIANIRKSTLFYVAAVLLIGAASTLVRAQSYDSCKNFSGNPHTKIDCIEAIFSASPAHLTFSSMPPGNGFAIGGVLEQNNHYVSSFALPGAVRLSSGNAAEHPPDYSPSQLPSLGSLWSADGRLAAIGSINGSWLGTGQLTLMPKGYVPSHRRDNNGVEVSCNKLGILCTKQVFGMHFEGTHRSLQTISFYGLGPISSAVKYIFPENDTYGSFRANLPLQDWLSIEGGFEYRQPDLPHSSAVNSVNNNFDNVTAPGLASQPGFAHSYAALRTSPRLYSSPKTDDKDLNHNGPLMKRYLLFTFRNSVEYHWWAAQGDSSQSFQQFVFDADENIQLATRVRRYVQVADTKGSRFLYAMLAVPAATAASTGRSRPTTFSKCASGAASETSTCAPTSSPR